MATCKDCNRLYGDEHGFPDMIIPNEAWEKINPNSCGGGLLCPSCICKRLYDCGLSNIPVWFASGPCRTALTAEADQLRKTLSITRENWAKELIENKKLKARITKLEDRENYLDVDEFYKE